MCRGPWDKINRVMEAKCQVQRVKPAARRFIHLNLNQRWTVVGVYMRARMAGFTLQRVVSIYTGGVAHIMRYNEQTDSLNHVLNVAEAVGEPSDSGRASQSKIHYSFAPSAEDGILYAATHLSAPGVGQKQLLATSCNPSEIQSMGDTGLELYPYSPRNTQILDQVAHNAAHLLSPGRLGTAIWPN